MFTLSEIEAAEALIRPQVPRTPTHHWPLLSARAGCEVHVKHENHAPTAAFKVRGAITFMNWLRRTQPQAPGIITATRGNHGQAQARAAAAAGLRAVIYVPHGNSPEKNAAMRAFGAELHEVGEDFDTAREAAMQAAAEEGLYFVPPFHRELVRGVATYGLEMFRDAPLLDAVYVPIGCGSGICGVIAARDALGLSTEVIGVVAEGASCAKLSFEAGRPVETAAATTFADGIAVRVPVPEALAVYREGASRIVAVSEAQIAEALRALYADTHNIAEGAGAAAMAALLAEADRQRGRRVGVVLSGSNLDAPRAVTALDGGVPAP